MNRIILLTLMVLCSSELSFAQIQTFELDTNIKVIESSKYLKKAWAGGLDCPMYSAIDLNHDGAKDLFIFDHKTNRVMTFVNNNIPNTLSYTYEHQYEKLFPRMHDWALMYDYNCDGLEDIFTHGNGGIACYQNTLAFPLQFAFITSQVNSTYHLGPNFWFLTNIYASSINVPAFADMDGDGDMDVLNFANGGNYIEYQRNYSMDSTGLCGGFRFYNIKKCWAYFTLNGAKHEATLPPGSIMDCPMYPATFPRGTDLMSTADTTRHAGNVLVAFDKENDSDQDLLVGDIIGTNLLFLENGGVSDSAYAISQDTLYPSYDVPAIMENVAAPYILDLDNDGKKDLLVANFNSDLFSGIGQNYFHTLYYKNVATVPNTHVFQYQNNNLFAEEMIDVGTGAHPGFIDVDADGDKDLLIANDYHFYSPTVRKAQITYYRNIGSATTPVYELVTRDFASLSVYNFTNIYPTFGDIDNDGDQDMLLGNADASITYFENTGGAGPVNLVLNTLNYQGISVGSSGHQSIPHLTDLNHDGLLDLVIGRRAGNLYYYENSGTPSNPVFTLTTDSLGNVSVYDPSFVAGFSAPFVYDSAGVTRMLVGSYSGTIYQYGNIDGNLSGSFTLIDSAYKGIFEPSNAVPALADLNGDGMLDIIVGNLGGGVRYYIQKITSGIKETTANPGFDFYPNPVSNELVLEFDENDSQKKEINIYNVLGVRIMQQSTRQKQQVINVEKIPSGSYIVSVNHNGKSISRKFVKL